MALATTFAPSERKNGDFDKIVDFIRLREDTALTPQVRPNTPPKPTPPPEIPTEIEVAAPNESYASTFTIDSSLLSMSGVPVAAQRGVAERGLIPISGVPPSYPRAAKNRRIEGGVELEFIITESGQVTDITIVSATNGEWFVEAAIKALSRWRFAPKTVNGKPVRQLARQVFTFKLE
jgi:protein TonB